MAGYGMALIAAFMATHFSGFRIVGLLLGLVTLVPAFLTLYNGVSNTFYGGVGLLFYNSILFLFICLTAAFVLTALAAQYFVRTRDLSANSTESDRTYCLLFALAAAICLSASIIMIFFQGDSLNLKEVWTAVGGVLAPDQYSLPVVAGLLILGVVVAFVGSLFLYRQRAPLAITLALFAIMPLSSGLSHWAHSEQRNHWLVTGLDTTCSPRRFPDRTAN